MEDEQPVEQRAKRQKTDKFGRFAALKRLKDLKGSKHKYELDDVDNVYETVDETEYSKRVVEKNDDWIVDDGTGYFEDGRDIFDDDLDSESIASASKSKGGTSKKRKKGISENAGKGNLHHMISNMSSKPKKEATKLEDDDVLSELISEISSDSGSKASTFTPPAKRVSLKSSTSLFAEKKAAKDYMKGFSIAKKVNPMKPVPLVQNDEPEEVEVLKEVQNTITNMEAEAETIQSEVATLETEKSENIEPVVVKGPRKLFEIKVEEKPVEEVPEDETLDIESYFEDDFDMTQIDESQISNEKDSKIDSQLENSDWEKLAKSQQDFNAVQENIKYDTSQLPMTKDDDENEVLRFFWWDAYDTPMKPGCVFLFGKIYNESTKTYASCCVSVKNIDRNLFFLPRTFHEDDNEKPVTMLDVYNELNSEIFPKINVHSFKSRTVTKNYCFDPTVPAQSEYMEVRYSASSPSLADDLSGKTFSRVFGTLTSSLELFLLSHKIKGPCWLDITDPEPVTNPMSSCKYEVICNSSSNIKLTVSSKSLSPPPLVVACVNMKTITNQGLKSEIVMINVLVQTSYHVNKKEPNPLFQQHFCVVVKPQTVTTPYNMHEVTKSYKRTNVQKMDTERGLLNYFVTQFDKIDPDLVVGHDMQGYIANVLAQRMEFNNISNWSRLGKMKRSQMSKFKAERDIFLGRLVCDLKISAKELIKSRSYDLGTLCQTVLKIDEDKRIEIEPEEVARMFYTPQDLIKLIVCSMQDAMYIIKMMFELNVIPLALQITNIAGNVMSKTLLGGRSERNEFLLLHAFSDRDYIVPDKTFKKKTENQSASARKKPTYAGGLVLDPKIGLYEKFILLMDFNSLYPSIIQEYNICFTTITDVNEEENIVLPDSTLAPGILPTEIRKLVESRKGVKTLMKNPDLSQDLKLQYHIRQMALKLTANSMYGCLGFSNSRFYAKGLAALVTMKGREILTTTKDVVQKMCHEVIYGDTDSIMINTNSIDYEQVYKIGKQIKQEINKMYRQVELDIDGVFKNLLLVKKKKYAAVILSKGKKGELVEEIEHKGLDIVRRDWSKLSAEAGKFTVNHLLSDQSFDDKLENIITHLGKLKEDLDNGRVPLSLLVITKQLTKDPKAYPDKNALPHVQVALRYNKKGGKQFRPGDVVPYVVCLDGTTNSATQRAYHVDELKNSTTLKIDINYYITQQVYPVIARLVEPVSEIKPDMIAMTLGMSILKRTKAEVEGIQENIRTSAVKFRNTIPFKFICNVCQNENSITGPLIDNIPFLQKCSESTCNARPVDYLSSILRQLHDSINEYISKFYLNEMTCEDPACGNDSETFITSWFVGKYPVCPQCESCVMYKKYTEQDLYSQLSYFEHIFDLSKHEKVPLMESRIELAYKTLKEEVRNLLNQSAYSEVDLSELFMFLIDEKMALIMKDRALKAKTSQFEMSQIGFEPIEAQSDED